MVEGGGGELVDDFGGDEAGAGEDVELELVASAELLVGEAAAFGFSKGAVAGDEVIEVATHYSASRLDLRRLAPQPTIYN